MVEFVSLEPRRYAYLRHLGPYPEIGGTFGKMAAIAGRAGLTAQPGALFVAVYHDDPGTTPPERLTSDAGISIAEGTGVPEGLQEGLIAAGRYAKGVHRGSYEKMGDSWMALYAALHESGAKMRGVSPFEIYVSDMDTTPVSELVTELYVAVE